MSSTVDLSDVAAQANRDLEGASPLQILSWAHAQFGTKLVVASSMADTVMIHLAEQVSPGIDVIFLDTGYHFVETIGTRDAVKLVHNVNVINVTPEYRATVETDVDAGTDGGRAGRNLGQGSVRPRSRPVLRTPQGRPARQGP